MENFNRILKESAPILFLLVLAELLAGVVLSSYQEHLNLIPGLLILLPAILSLRGNVSSALGSRLGSAIHLGTIDSVFSLSIFRTKAIKENVYASIILNISLSFFLGVCAYFVAIGVGLQEVNLLALVLISLIAGTISGLFLTFLTVFLAVYTASKGLDPDNVLTPTVATIGDVFTVLFLFLSADFILFIL
ncbi:MAG: magnesium transporter [Candidatus Altiarchaeota archaeon]|nr:magnesium transporter [Candidatus Altiarchaeota archaeon]